LGDVEIDVEMASFGGSVDGRRSGCRSGPLVSAAPTFRGFGAGCTVAAAAALAFRCRKCHAVRCQKPRFAGDERFDRENDHQPARVRHEDQVLYSALRSEARGMYATIAPPRIAPTCFPTTGTTARGTRMRLHHRTSGLFTKPTWPGQRSAQTPTDAPIANAHTLLEVGTPMISAAFLSCGWR